jgi:hypothetical protein
MKFRGKDVKGKYNLQCRGEDIIKVNHDNLSLKIRLVSIGPGLEPVVPY